MADENLMTQEEFLTYEGLDYFKQKQDAVNDQKIATAKQEATDYADDTFEVKGTAQTKMEELANGAVKDNADAISGLTESKADKVQVATDIENAVKVETEARNTAIAGVQGEVDALEQTHATDKAALEASIKGISDDYLKAADKTELQGNIDTVNAAVERLTNGVSADEVDGVNDLIQYVKDHGTEVTGMQEGIADNAEAIEAVAGRATTLEGEMDAVEAAVATKVEQEVYNTKVTALEGEDTAMKARLDALEEAIGEDGDVAGQIDAKIADLDATVASTDVEEGKGLKVTTVQTDGKLVSVAVEGDFDATYDALGSAATAKTEAIEAAATDATTKANQAEANAKAEVTALADGAVATNTAAIAEIKTNMPTPIANSKIDELFATTE